MIKKALFVLILFVLISPALQQIFGIVAIKPLHGSFTLPPKPTLEKLNWQEWFSGGFQNDFNSRLEENVGFRNYLIRILYQLDFSLFKEVHTVGVVVGKDNYLYENSYINAYNGTDFSGTHRIVDQSHKIQLVKDKLHETGKDLLILFAPGKGSFYPEYIPEKFLGDTDDTTNYAYYVRCLNEFDVPLLDFKDYFTRIKSESPYALFPKAGIHWSTYGAALVSDSLVGYLNSHYGLRLPKFEYHAQPVNDSLKYTGFDYDIGVGLNILSYINQPDLAIVDIDYPDIEDSLRPDVLVIGDSYFINLIRAGFPEAYFDNYQFWYYNRTIYPRPPDSSNNLKDYDTMKEIAKYDIILIIATDANLWKFPFGIIDELYNRMVMEDSSDKVKYYRDLYVDHLPLIFPENSQRFDRIKALLNKQGTINEVHGSYLDYLDRDRFSLSLKLIKYQSGLYRMAVSKAKTRQISVGEMINLDARWMVNDEKRYRY
ncbi:MAG: hypothetical protein KKA81_08930 [Bacteroidetes bacterium]|nr:hypothetical protein [Bacteroidota bacterium]